LWFTLGHREFFPCNNMVLWWKTTTNLLHRRIYRWLHVFHVSPRGGYMMRVAHGAMWHVVKIFGEMNGDVVWVPRVKPSENIRYIHVCNVQAVELVAWQVHRDGRMRWISMWVCKSSNPWIWQGHKII
jgi:hypothetical protein